MFFLAYLSSAGTQHRNLPLAGDLFYSVGLHRIDVLATANTREIGRGFGKNAGEWMGRVEISKEEISGSKRSMYSYILTYPTLYRGNV